MPTMYVRKSTGWVSIPDGGPCQVNHNGTWKTPKEVYVKNGSSWVKVWTDWGASLTGLPSSVSSTSTTTAAAEAGVGLYSNGYIVKVTNSGTTVVGSWDGSGSSSYNSEVYIRGVSGNTGALSGTTSGYVPMTSNRVVKLISTQDSLTATVRITLRKLGDSSSAITEDVTLTANKDSGGDPL